MAVALRLNWPDCCLNASNQMSALNHTADAPDRRTPHALPTDHKRHKTLTQACLFCRPRRRFSRLAAALGLPHVSDSECISTGWQPAVTTISAARGPILLNIASFVRSRSAWICRAWLARASPVEKYSCAGRRVQLTAVACLRAAQRKAVTMASCNVFLNSFAVSALHRCPELPYRP
eukprot:COSAG01_NODE_1839_length_9079_cov_16.478731_5_plen_177_part_00